MAKKTTRRRPGRPQGARNQQHDRVHVEVSRCRKCNSTERSPYTHKTTKAVSGERDGKPFNRIVWRRTKCLACGQARIDQMFELVEV